MPNENKNKTPDRAPAATRNFHAIDFDRKLIESLPQQGPRYTSYPTADRFLDSFGPDDYAKALGDRALDPERKPLSLYIHVPFCSVACFYCACNKIATKDHSKAERYLGYLEKEMALVRPKIKGNTELEQLHFGGGTPTFLNDEQFDRVFAMIRSNFKMADDGEYSIEIDPRKVGKQRVRHLAQLGLNRMSVGIQDFDPKVQAAVNRVQSVEETFSVIEAAREAGFKSVSVDLMYGLPHQTVETIEKTLLRALQASPDRLALYHYAHLPHIFMPQRRIDAAAVPDSPTKMDILQRAVEILTEKGYVFIGMDHFAKPDDELAIALGEGKLQRNFQGYSTHAECDLIGLGVSSIGKVGDNYIQSYRDLESYYAKLDQGVLPVMRGYALSRDDALRRSVIQALMCRFALDFKEFEDQYGIVFKDYFEVEMAELGLMQKTGLVKLEDGGARVTDKGRFVIRNIAMVFDWHLRNRKTKATYSKTV